MIIILFLKIRYFHFLIKVGFLLTICFGAYQISYLPSLHNQPIFKKCEMPQREDYIQFAKCELDLHRNTAHQYYDCEVNLYNHEEFKKIDIDLKWIARKNPREDLQKAALFSGAIIEGTCISIEYHPQEKTLFRTTYQFEINKIIAKGYRSEKKIIKVKSPYGPNECRKLPVRDRFLVGSKHLLYLNPIERKVRSRQSMFKHACDYSDEGFKDYIERKFKMKFDEKEVYTLINGYEIISNRNKIFPTDYIKDRGKFRRLKEIRSISKEIFMLNNFNS